MFSALIGACSCSREESFFSRRNLVTVLGQRYSPEQRKAHQGQSGTLQVALLGLLGLLLGFTFAMAVGRFESRKQLVLDEANGIGTTWLRAGYLSERARDAIRPTLLE